eukprot:1594625-Ditylum_brightwellii.AAC.1
MKTAMKTDGGLKTVMAILTKEESSNQEFASALSTSALPPTPTTSAPPAQPPTQASTVTGTLASTIPATSLKLSSILKRK